MPRFFLPVLLKDINGFRILIPPVFYFTARSGEIFIRRGVLLLPLFSRVQRIIEQGGSSIMTSSQALCTPSPGLGSGFANFCGFCFGLLCCLFRKENRRAPNQHPSRHFREPIPQPRFCHFGGTSLWPRGDSAKNSQTSARRICPNSSRQNPPTF